MEQPPGPEIADRYQRLVEAAPDGIVVHRDGVILYANPSADRIFAAPPGALVGRRVLDLVHEDDRDIVRERIHRIEHEGERTEPRELRGLRLDGSPVDIEAAGHPVIYDGRIADQSIVRDITRRKTAEAELRLQTLARPLVRDIMLTLLRHVPVPQEAAADVGRRLSVTRFETVGAAVAAFRTMGLGDLRLVRQDAGRIEFEGHDLLEHRSGVTQPTCYLSLGFLEGALTGVMGAQVRGMETRCCSLGHETCRFVLMLRPATG